MGEINGFKLMADAYKKELDNTPEEYRAEMQAKIKANEFLAGADDATIYALFDSSAFNTIVKGYVKLALHNTDTDSEKAREIMNEINYLFSIKTAQEAEAYY
ncbi:MAG: hypothetical protein J5601_03715 [Elusimicrobiaceae bacterium]|nr:hypothetical protein [Elusimicrobiaceae bacterium]